MERQLFVGAEHESRAVYLYAGQGNTHTIVNKPASAVRAGSLPPWMRSPADLDFLDPANPLFVVDRALFSCGPYLHRSSPPGMFSPRPGATMLGDSGGYQFIGNPALWLGNATRAFVLDWQEENTNEAITLDIPTAAIKTGTPWPTFQDALDCTVDSLRFFATASSGKTRHLNALQGRDRKEALAWYDAVKWFPGGGWAFGGIMRKDFLHVVRLLDQMATEGKLSPKRNRIHFLGMADLQAAVMLSAIQQGMRDRLDDPAFLITFDVSTPSIMMANGYAYGFPNLSSTSFSMTQWKPSSLVRPAYAQSPWPIASSAIGSLLSMGDLCVGKPGSVAQTAWDSLSEAMLVNHNVQSLLAAIRTANTVMELHPTDAAQLAPLHVIRAYHALKGACTARDPVAYLRPFTADLKGLGR